MNTSLLRYLRFGEQRLRPAVVSHRRRRPRGVGLVYEIAGIFRQLSSIPLSLSREVRLLFPDSGPPGSKWDNLATEFKEEGLAGTGVHQEARTRASVRLGRIIARLWWAIPLGLRCLVTLSRVDLVHVRLLVQWVAWRRLFCRYPKTVAVVLSDVTPRLHSVWSAAATEGVKVLWFQDDFHHTGNLPYPADIAVVLNEGGCLSVRRANPAARIYLRALKEPITIRSARSSTGTLGIAVNAYFSPGPETMATLSKIRWFWGSRQIRLRPHPRSVLDVDAFKEHGIEIAPRHESLATFANSVRLAIVGNSAVQFRLLLEGVPVVHIAGLDPHRFDLYGYVRSGIVFGTPDLEPSCVGRVDEHYARRGVRKAIDSKRRGELPPMEGIRALANDLGTPM